MQLPHTNVIQLQLQYFMILFIIIYCKIVQPISMSLSMILIHNRRMIGWGMDVWISVYIQMHKQYQTLQIKSYWI